MVGTNPTGSMLHLFLGLKSLVKVSRFHTDCSVFRLHYRVTVMVLLAFTFIVTSRQYIGAAIMCVHSEEIPKEVQCCLMQLCSSECGFLHPSL